MWEVGSEGHGEPRGAGVHWAAAANPQERPVGLSRMELIQLGPGYTHITAKRRAVDAE